MRKSIFTILFSLFSIFWVVAQQGDNPFDLNHRLEKPIVKEPAKPGQTEKTGNPFDIRSREEAAVRAPDMPVDPPLRAPQLSPVPEGLSEVTAGSFTFWIISLSIALTAIILTLFRSAIGKSYKAFLNDNVLRLMYREQYTFFSWPFILYAFFLFNAGIFTFLLTQHFDIRLEMGNWQLLLYGILAIGGYYFFKHFLLKALAFIFPVQKEVLLYNFTITIFNIILGLMLVPFNLFIAFSPSETGKILIFAALILMGLIYLYRSLRGIFIASKYLTFNKFHFFIYLCTIEIAPLAIVVKLVLNQMPN